MVRSRKAAATACIIEISVVLSVQQGVDLHANMLFGHVCSV